MTATRFGDGFSKQFVIEPERRRLIRNGEPVPIPARAFDLLQILVAERHRTVSKEELMALVWPGVTVTENSLNQCVSSLRKALEDSRQEPRYIATIPNLGYRFVAAIEADPAPKLEVSTPKSSRVPARTAVALVVAVGVSIAAWRSWPSDRVKTNSRVVAFVNETRNEEYAWLAASLAEMTAARLGLPPPEWTEDSNVSRRTGTISGSYRVSPDGKQIRLRLTLGPGAAGPEWSGPLHEFPAVLRKALPRSKIVPGEQFAAYRLSEWSSALHPLRAAVMASARPNDEIEARAALGITLYQLGRVREAAVLLGGGGSGVPDAAVARGFWHAANNRWAEAVEAFSIAWARHPDDNNLGLALAEAQFLMRDGKAARTTLNSMANLWPQASSDPRWLLASARVAGHFQNMDRVEDLARKAVAEAGRHGRTDSLAGRAALLAAGSMMNLGNDAEGARWRTKARQVCLAARDLLCLAATARVEGNAAMGVGRFQDAAAAYQQTLRLTRLAGSDRERAHALNGYGAVLLSTKSYVQAEAVYREGTRLDVRAWGLARTGWYTGLTESLLGQRRFDEAYRAAADSLQIASEDHDNEGVAHAYANLACALASRQRTQEAAPVFAKAVRLFTALRNPRLLAQVLERGRSLGLYGSNAASFRPVPGPSRPGND